MSAAVWFPPSAQARHEPLSADLETGVAIVGGGLMGLTAAAELARTGVPVALLERSTIGAGETGHTTAHVTARPDVEMHALVDNLGADGASAYWAAMSSALRHIAANAERGGVPFQTVDAWLFGRDLERELEALLTVGASAAIDAPPTMFSFKRGLRVRDQARFDIAQYLRHLERVALEAGVRIFEGSAVVGHKGDALEVESALGTFSVRSDRVILATHVPLFASPVLLDRLQADQSYAVALAVPGGSSPDVLAEDDEDPYHYYRLEPGAGRASNGEDIVIFGGLDHHTGAHTPDAPSEHLEALVQRWLPGVKTRLVRAWSGELWTVADGRPVIGEDSHGRFYGTGFAGVGMTQATLAGLMATAWAQGRDVPWQDLFSVARFSGAELPGIVRRGASFVAGLAKGVMPRRLPAADALEPGAGAIVRDEGGKTVAAYRDLNGDLLTLNPHCTHAGCEVAWNAQDRTWDCPCHGSRFHAGGEVRAGPAVHALKPLEVDS
jgi:glycine/D-amino acid oxidase-like deaminating enzyme/nitrite reductase/ring-hydroxylating ferredoxin subunit